MNIDKRLKELNIEPIYEIDVRQKCEFANKVAVLILDTFPEYNLDYIKIVELLQHTKIYFAKVPKNISPVNYSYVDEAMYVSDDIELDIKNEYVLHEVIHRIQETRNKKNELKQLGICNIYDTKIQGLAMNEGAIQYIVHKLLNTELQMVEIYDMKIPTISKKYYPMLTNLIEQITFLLGDKFLIDSCLNTKEDFKYNAIDNLSEKTYFTIQSNFDKILEAKDNILKGVDIQININCIKQTYMETQNMIFTSYFDHLFKRIETTDDFKLYYNKLLNYRNFIGTGDGNDFYAKYCNDKEKQIKELENQLNNKALAIINENKLLRILKKILNYFFGRAFSQF